MILLKTNSWSRKKIENHHPNAAAALIRSGADALAEADDRQRSNLFHLAAENGDTAGRLITVAQNKPNINNPRQSQLATSAAPMYFEEHFYDRFVDGGTMVNNHKHLMQW